MFHKALIRSSCILCLFLASCVTKGRYTELETSLNAQLKEKNDSLSDLQARWDELQSENARLSGTIDELTRNLGQARLEIQNKERDIEQLTLDLDQARSVIRQHESALGELKLALAQTQSVVQQKEIKISELDQTRRDIESSLKEQIAQKDIKIEEIEGKLRVTFVDKILFDSGSTRIKDRGQDVLLTLAESFKDDTSRKIVVEGHTDDIDIGYPLRERFPTNWELSTARAATVVRFLQEKAGITPDRLAATGYSYYRPVAPNDTEETRSQNRRIEIILVPVR